MFKATILHGQFKQDQQKMARQYHVGVKKPISHSVASKRAQNTSNVNLSSVILRSGKECAEGRKKLHKIRKYTP